MTATRARVVRVQSGPGIKHPLAHRSGARLLVELIAAAQVWKGLSEQQREALRLAYRRGLAEAVAAGVPDGGEVDPPRIPADTHPLSRHALERRGLVVDGRVTALGLQVTRLASMVDGRRRVETVRVPAGRL